MNLYQTTSEDEINNCRFEQLLSAGLAQMVRIPKSDLHNHAAMGGSIEYLSRQLNTKLMEYDGIFDGLDDLKKWSLKCIDPYFKGLFGYLKRVEATFVNAKNDGVSVLAINFSLEEILMFKNLKSFIRMIEKIKLEYAPDIIMLPEVSLRWTYDIDFIMSNIEEILDSDWFYSIDTCGRELAQPIEKFKQIYAMAKKSGLKLLAHVGEIKPAYYIQQAVEELELDQVHHGITAAKSKSVMRFLANNHIQLNVCPYCNIKLGIVETYSAHPIRILYDNDVPITINSDDMLAINQTVSQQYLSLYTNKVFDANELNEIRKVGLQVDIAVEGK